MEFRILTSEDFINLTNYPVGMLEFENKQNYIIALTSYVNKTKWICCDIDITKSGMSFNRYSVNGGDILTNLIWSSECS